MKLGIMASTDLAALKFGRLDNQMKNFHGETNPGWMKDFPPQGNDLFHSYYISLNKIIGDGQVHIYYICPSWYSYHAVMLLRPKLTI